MSKELTGKEVKPIESKEEAQKIGRQMAVEACKKLKLNLKLPESELTGEELTDEKVREEVRNIFKELFAEYGVRVSTPLGLEYPDREAYIIPIWVDQILAFFNTREKAVAEEIKSEALKAMEIYNSELRPNPYTTLVKALGKTSGKGG